MRLSFLNKKICKPSARIIKKKKGGTQMHKIRNGRGKVISAITEIQKV